MTFGILNALKPELRIIVQYVGLVVVVAMLVRFIRIALKSLSRPVNPLSYGKWAVITGATDGIGRAFSFEFAKRGMNVLIISRTQAKLDAMKIELESQYPSIKVKVLAIDYSNFDKAAQSTVKAELQKLDSFGILVNNVGMSYPFPVYFHELSDEEVRGMIDLNINSTTWMTRIAIPIMLTQKKGLILNIGSAAGLHPNPLLTEYSASKAYVENFSHALNTEYGPFGITIQCHVPLFIVSKLSKYKKPSAFVPTAETYAKEAMNTLGLDPVVSPHFLHQVASFLLTLVPSAVFQSLSLKFHLGIRKLGLKKRARNDVNNKKSS